MKKIVYYKSKYDIKRELDKIAPENEYRNLNIAKIIAIGKKDFMNDDWIRRAVFRDWDDGLIDNYDTTLRLYNLYSSYLKNTFVHVK